MGKAQCRMLERPPLTLIAAPGAPAKAVDWMVARGARQVVPAVRGFTPGYAAARLTTVDPSGARTICAHGSLLHCLRLRVYACSGRPSRDACGRPPALVGSPCTICGRAGVAAMWRILRLLVLGLLLALVVALLIAILAVR